jgi:ribosomal protein L21E
MSTQQPAAPVERVTYGNLRPPRRPGVLGMGMAASILVGVAAVIVVIMLMTFGVIAAAVVLLVSVLVLTPMIVRGPDGHSGYQRLLGRVVFRHAAKAGHTTYLAGATGQTPDGRTRLPGLLAQSELLEAVDAYGDAYGVLHTPGVDHYAAVLASEAAGNDLVDQSVTDSAVAHWGGWMAHLGQQPDILAATVTIETAPDPGTRLVRMVKRHTQDSAPEFSLATLDEITTQYPAASSTTSTRIALTFSSRPRPGEDKRSQQDVLADLGRRLPGLRQGLRTTGAGTTVRMMTAADLTDAVRVAYDPSVAQLVEEQRGQGGTGLAWSEAGPAFAHDLPEHYAHDGAFSIVWQMREAPPGVFYDNSLKSLLAPHSDIARKRVTLIYRPQSAETARRMVERDVRDARTQASARTRPQAHDATMLRSAEKAAQEEAQGAGLVRFGIIVTATVTDEAQLPRAASTISMLTAPTKLRLRLARYNQAASFAAGLPLGLVLPTHLALPEWARDTL